MKKLGMNTLLGVGRGSIRGSYLVTLEYYGNKKQKLNYFLLLEKVFVLIQEEFPLNLLNLWKK